MFRSSPNYLISQSVIRCASGLLGLMLLIITKRIFDVAAAPSLRQLYR